VVIDQSGSMDLSSEQLDELLSLSPSLTVIGYSHRPGDVAATPNVWILARGGRRVASDDLPSGNVGNGVDLPVLEFANGLRRSGEPTSADVAGCFMPAKDGFAWLDGAALRAWQGNGQRGGRLVIDEIDRASGDVLSQLLAFTDSEASATFLHPVTGETVRPLPGFSVIMTTNLEDPDDLAPALRDRFAVALRIDKAHDAGLAKLPDDLRPLAASMVGTGTGRKVSLRTFYAFDTLRTRMGTEHAAQLVFGSQRAESLLDAIAINNVEVGRLDLFQPPTPHPLEGAAYGVLSDVDAATADPGFGLEVEH
jgi:hypothetical protein